MPSDLFFARRPVRNDLGLSHHPLRQGRQQGVGVHNRSGDAVQNAALDPVQAGDDGDVADGQLFKSNERPG